jgi:hypothetical protein
MKNLIASCGKIRAAISKSDHLTSLAFHAVIAAFILLLWTGLSHHLTGSLIFVLAVDALMVGMSAAALTVFGEESICRGFRLESMGRFGEIAYGALCGGAAWFLWSIPYSTVRAFAPTIASAFAAGLAFSLLINALGMISGAVSLASFSPKFLLPSRRH